MQDASIKQAWVSLGWQHRGNITHTLLNLCPSLFHCLPSHFLFLYLLFQSAFPHTSSLSGAILSVFSSPLTLSLSHLLCHRVWLSSFSFDHLFAPHTLQFLSRPALPLCHLALGAWHSDGITQTPLSSGSASLLASFMSLDLIALYFLHRLIIVIYTSCLMLPGSISLSVSLCSHLCLHLSPSHCCSQNCLHDVILLNTLPSFILSSCLLSYVSSSLFT